MGNRRSVGKYMCQGRGYGGNYDIQYAQKSEADPHISVVFHTPPPTLLPFSLFLRKWLTRWDKCFCICGRVAVLPCIREIQFVCCLHKGESCKMLCLPIPLHLPYRHSFCTLDWLRLSVLKVTRMDYKRYANVGPQKGGGLLSPWGTWKRGHQTLK